MESMVGIFLNISSYLGRTVCLICLFFWRNWPYEFRELGTGALYTLRVLRF